MAPTGDRPRLIVIGSVLAVTLITLVACSQTDRPAAIAVVDPGAEPPSRSVIVAVVDTGVARVDGLDALLADTVRCTPSCVPAPPWDGDGHGTEVASLVASVARAATSGTLPLQLVGVQTADERGTLSVERVAGGLQWAGAAGIPIVAMSLVLGSDDPAVATAIAAAPDTLFIVPAGNDGLDLDSSATPVHPCVDPSPNVICVAASAPDGRLTGDSNRGTTSVDVAAPGTGLATTSIGGREGRVSGTSYAVAVVAGTAALVRAEFADLRASALAAALRCGAAVVQEANATASGGVVNLAGTRAALAPGGCAHDSGTAPRN